MRGRAEYDLVVIGGGIAGSTLAIALAGDGARVLVVEKTREFDDRIRGEIIMPWGVAEARTLGVDRLLCDGGAIEVPAEISYINGIAAPPRDFASTTPGRSRGLSFYHPHMQQWMLDAVSLAGAEVWRGGTARAIDPGPSPVAEIEFGGRVVPVGARLIVGADGRDSRVATLMGWERSKDPTELFIGGFQCSGHTGAVDALHFFLHGVSGRGAIIIRTGPANHRAYILHHKDALPKRLSGERDYRAAMEHFHEIGIPSEWLAGLTPHGTFASFDAAHRWIANPVRGACVLIGDAAGASDPVWGNGLSRTLRDVRMLRDRLLSDDDWPCAAAAYAVEHDEQFKQLRRAERLNTAIFFAMGETGERRREHAFALMSRRPGLFPDLTGSGPSPLTDETVAMFLPAGEQRVS